MGDLLIREPAILCIPEKAESPEDEAYFATVRHLIAKHNLPKDAGTMVYGLLPFLRAPKKDRDSILDMACPDVTTTIQKRMLSVVSDLIPTLKKCLKGIDGAEVPSAEVLERFCRIADINGHSSHGSGWLLFQHGSKVAHSCAPTTSFRLLSPAEVARRYARHPALPFALKDAPPILEQTALCALPRGAVVTMGYTGSAFDLIAPTAIRQSQLEHLAFVCACPRCRGLDYTRGRKCVSCGAGSAVPQPQPAPSHVVERVRVGAGDLAADAIDAAPPPPPPSAAASPVGVVSLLCVRSSWGLAAVAAANKSKAQTAGDATGSDDVVLPIPYAAARAIHSAWAAAAAAPPAAAAATAAAAAAAAAATAPAKGGQRGGRSATGKPAAQPATAPPPPPPTLHVPASDTEALKVWGALVLGTAPLPTATGAPAMVDSRNVAEPWLSSQAPAALGAIGAPPPTSPLVHMYVCVACGVSYGVDTASPSAAPRAAPCDALRVDAAAFARALSLESARVRWAVSRPAQLARHGVQSVAAGVSDASQVLFALDAGSADGPARATLARAAAPAMKTFAAQSALETSILQQISPRYIAHSAPRYTAPVEVLRMRSSVSDGLGGNHFVVPLLAFALCSLLSGADAQRSAPWPPYATAVAPAFASQLTRWLDAWLPWSQQAAAGHAVAARVYVDALGTAEKAFFVASDESLHVALHKQLGLPLPVGYQLPTDETSDAAADAEEEEAGAGTALGDEATDEAKDPSGPPTGPVAGSFSLAAALPMLRLVHRSALIGLALRSAVPDAPAAQLQNLTFIVTRLDRMDVLEAMATVPGPQSPN